MPHAQSPKAGAGWRPAQPLLGRTLPWLLALAVAACTFEPPPGLLFPTPLPPPNTPISAVVDSGEVTVFEQPGEIAVHHGFACAQSSQPEGQKILRIAQSRPIAPAMDRATVFLNGWQFRYLNGDHQVLGLGTGIINIRTENNLLRWEAWGAISDNNFDDPYRWCYRYTMLAWDRSAYVADRDDRDMHAFQGDNGARWETALRFHPAYIRGGHATETAAVLPRGFGFIWSGGADHNLLQLAYNLDYGERYIAGGKRYVSGGSNPPGIDRLGTDFISWETKTVFKDNALKRDHFTGELVSVITGTPVTVAQPPFTIVPREDRSNCVGFGEPASETRTIERVPFDVAVPVLTGWDLGYICDDEEVEEIGIWLDGFAYRPAGFAGELEYTRNAVLRDQDGGNGTRLRHRVAILGLTRNP